MIRPLLYLALFLGTLAAPLSAVAAPPADVRELWAVFTNGEIRLEWDPVSDDIDVYRIYYSQQSILENDGAYDDFIAAASRVTTFTMTELPPFPKIFFSVIAVNADGEESESFVEEIELDLSSGDMEGVRRELTVPSPSRKEREALQQALLSATSRSPTEVVLNFSASVRIAPEDMKNAVAIMDESGTPLNVASLVLEENTIIATTNGQIPRHRYGVRASPVISGERDGAMLPLDPGRSIVDFVGFGEEPTLSDPGVATSVSEESPAGELGIRNIRTRFDPDGSGRFSVIVGWDAPVAGEVASYAITPIAGTVVGKTTTVPAETRVVRFQRIQPGLFRVVIQPMSADGTSGPSVIAAADMGMHRPLQAAPELGAARSGGGLSSTGAGVVGIAIAAGAVAGWRRIRAMGKKPSTTDVL